MHLHQPLLHTNSITGYDCYRMAKWMYDPYPLPTYPYIKTTAAYSATIQWYAQSSQLPTAAGMKERGQGENTCHWLGCNMIEDKHHIFVTCKVFDKLRVDAGWEKVEKMRQKSDAAGLEEAQFASLLTTAKLLFYKCSKTWPLLYSFYYLGHIPKLDIHVNPNIFESRLKHERFIHNIYGDWHMSSIRLTSWIWGKVQKEMVKKRSVAYEK